MWQTNTLWFDSALVLGLFAVGNICFGRFVEHQSRGWRVAKMLLVLAAVLAFASYGLRVWAYGLLAVGLLVAIWVHGFWLPAHGVNGWTGEPRERYLELVMRRGRPGVRVTEKVSP